MRLRRVKRIFLTGIASLGFIVCVSCVPANGQTVGTPTLDPLSGYAGTWMATNLGETSPFLVLKLSEASGTLTGTISRFTVKGQRNGQITFKPLPQPADQISYMTISDNGDLSFRWVGDSPFHGGDVTFVAEGTDVAYINIPVSQDEWERIFADNWGLSRALPTIILQRQGTTSGVRQEAGSSYWEEESTTRLINQTEFLYKSHYGIYVDYPSLVRSGELEQSRENFTIMRLDLHSETQPFPGHTIRLVVSQDGAAYHLSIEWKPYANCSASLASDQTGVLWGFETGACTKAAGPR